MKSRVVIFAFAFVALSTIGLLVLFFFDARKQPERETSPFRGEVFQLLGREAVVLDENANLTGDAERDVLAYVPAGKTHTAEGKWAAHVLVLTRDNKKIVRLLHAHSGGLMAGKRALLSPLPVDAFYGYVFSRVKNTRTGLDDLRFYLSDSVGQPASDPLFVVWDSKLSSYTLRP